MLCSSSSSDLFCPSHPLFFPPPAPVLPPFAWFRFPCPDTPMPAENTCGVSLLLPSPASSLLGFVLGMGMLEWGRTGKGVLSLACWRERTPGLCNVGLKCSPETKCAINLAQGIPRAGPRSGHRSRAGGAQSMSHITLISLLFPFPPRCPWLAGGERSCCSGGCGVSVSRRRQEGVHMHIYT